MKYIYLHGFASGVTSTKARYFSQKFTELNIDLAVPDLNCNDFFNLTLTRQIEQTAACANAPQLKIASDLPKADDRIALQENNLEPVTIIGSSFGGFTAALVAEFYPQVERLVLLAPAFNFLDCWLPQLGEMQVKQWQESGILSTYHYGENKLLPLSYQFVEDTKKYDAFTLQKQISTLIIHGINDDVIPIEVSYTYSLDRPWVKLRELNSDHALTDVLELIWQETIDFLEL